MIIALDIETIGNPEAVPFLPEVKAHGRLKDPAKIAEDIAQKKADQVAELALDPLTGRVCAYATVGKLGADVAEYAASIDDADDENERKLIQEIMAILGIKDVRIVTWNGAGFDLPYVYKRALVLGVDPGHFGAPPLSAWTKRYNTDRHYDLMQIWGGWRDFVKLDTVAGLVLRERKTEIDVTTFAELIKTGEGREKIMGYCLQDTRLTWRLFERMNGFLFS